MHRWIACNGQMLPEIVILNRWRPNRDAICDVECDLWCGLLRSFWWQIFRPVNLPPEDQGVVDWVRNTGLDVRVAGDIFLLQTHVTALLLGVSDANRALRAGTISRFHPMFFSEPESALEDIFLSQSGSHPHSICPLQLEISGCLFVLGNAFLTAWKNAWRCPRQFFSGARQGVRAFLVEALDRRPRFRPVFYSLEFMVLFFLTFFNRFIEQHPLPRDVHRSVLFIFLSDVVRRFSFFPTREMVFVYWQIYLNLTGSICAACDVREWNFEQRPMSLNLIDLGSEGMIYHCVPIVEESLVHSLAEETGLSIKRAVSILHSLYDESGRSDIAINHALLAHIGGLRDSLPWMAWRALLPRIFSDCFSNMLSEEQVLVHRTPSLRECVAWQTLQNNSGRDPSYAAVVSYFNALTETFFCDYYENVCALGRLRNEEGQGEALLVIHTTVHPRDIVIGHLMDFITNIDLVPRSSAEELQRVANMVEAILSGLPFCFRDRSQCILVASVMEWCRESLFGDRTPLQNHRAHLLSLDPDAFSRVIWIWIQAAYEKGMDLNDLEVVRDEFLFQFSLFYTMYFAVDRASDD